MIAIDEIRALQKLHQVHTMGGNFVLDSETVRPYVIQNIHKFPGLFVEGGVVTRRCDDVPASESRWIKYDNLEAMARARLIGLMVTVNLRSGRWGVMISKPSAMPIDDEARSDVSQITWLNWDHTSQETHILKPVHDNVFHVPTRCLE